MRSERRPFNTILKAILIVLAIVGALAITLIVVFANILGSAGGAPGNLSSAGGGAYNGPSYDYIAKISVVGEISDAYYPSYSSDAIYHHDWTIATIDTLIKDNNNKAIYLYLDTPGGTVYESDALYLKLMEYKEKTERPVYVYMGTMAASGGYYVAAAADYIYANRNTWTGSIGVTLSTMFDVTGFLDEHGIKAETITAGKNKAMGSNYDPMTHEQREIFQGLVDDAYDQFVGIVATGRNMEEKKVREIADGRLYTASQALSNGLIDEIMGEKEAEDAVVEKIGGKVRIDNAYYKPATNLLSSLGVVFNQGGSSMTEKSNSLNSEIPPGDVAAVLDLIERQTESGGPEPMYLFNR